MRIGIFTDTYPPYINGVSTSIAMLEKALKKKGHQVFIVTVNPEERSYSFSDHMIKIPGIPIGIYDYRLSNIYPLKAVKKIKEWNLDIIHSHTEFGIGTFARVIAHQLDIPLVHTYHTMYEDYVHYITKGYFDRSSKKVVEYLTLFYCDKTVNELIVPTKKTYDLFKEKYQVDRNIYIIPTGIEIERFYDININKTKLTKIRKKLNLEDDDYVGLFVGRLAQEKNVEFLLEVANDLKKKLPKFKLLIVGDGPDIEKYRDIVKEYGIEDRVFLPGKVKWEDVPYYYHLSNIFLTASHTETQGLTVIEAMAAGSVPICVKDESFESMVVDDLTGKIFNTKEECEKIIEDLYKDKKTLGRLSSQAILNSDRFSSKYFAESVLDVYKHAIENNKKRRSFIEKIVDNIVSEKE